MRRLATLLIAVTSAVWGTAPALAAEGDPVTGYWTRTNTGLPIPVQPPDPVPEGGTWVAADPSGPLALSALRTDLAAGLVAVELRLTVADAVGVPDVQACPTDDRWAPAEGGRLEGAPVADCAAPLEAAVDGDVLVVPLPPGLDAVNVLLRPAPGSSFSLTLERATAESVVTAPESAPLAPAPPPAFTPTGPAFEGAALPPFAPAAPPAGPLLAAPQAPPPVAAPPAPAPQAAPPPSAVLQRPRAAVVPDDRTESLVAVAVLALLAAQAVVLARQPAVAPRALGGAARHVARAPDVVVATPVTTRGVGRFRTVRARPPVRI